MGPQGWLEGRSVDPARTSGPGGWPEEESSWVEECPGFVSEIAGRQPRWTHGRSAFFWLWSLETRSQQKNRPFTPIGVRCSQGRLYRHFRNYIPAPVLSQLILLIFSLISRLIFELHWPDWLNYSPSSACRVAGPVVRCRLPHLAPSFLRNKWPSWMCVWSCITQFPAGHLLRSWHREQVFFIANLLVSETWSTENDPVYLWKDANTATAKMWPSA